MSHQTTGGIIDAASGALDPEIERVGEYLAGLVPPGFFTSDTFKRLFGVVKQAVEGRAEHLPPALRTLVERLTDVGDVFSASLGENDHAKKPETATDWRTAYFGEVRKRLAAAKTNDGREEVVAAVRTELALLREIAGALGLEQEPRTHGEHESLREQLRVANDAWEADLARRERARGFAWRNFWPFRGRRS